MVNAPYIMAGIPVRYKWSVYHTSNAATLILQSDNKETAY